jgi:hypothetical protein
MVSQGAVGTVAPSASAPPMANLPPRKSNSAEISIGRALAILTHPKMAWPTLSTRDKVRVVIAYVIIAALVVAAARSGR